jgi:hypothetical protein
VCVCVRISACLRACVYSCEHACMTPITLLQTQSSLRNLQKLIVCACMYVSACMYPVYNILSSEFLHKVYGVCVLVCVNFPLFKCNSCKCVRVYVCTRAYMSSFFKHKLPQITFKNKCCVCAHLCMRECAHVPHYKNNNLLLITCLCVRACMRAF